MSITSADRLIDKQVKIPIDDVELFGNLVIPQHAESVIVFSHGSGSSRFSKRNQQVADYLQERNMGTLLFDLLTEEEDIHYFNRFDISLLTKRLIGVTNWIKQVPEVNNIPIGYFGASTGAACAIRASDYLTDIFALVSRGGRPDLVETEVLQQAKVPTLLIVGDLDTQVLELNQAVFSQLTCEKRVEIIEGASHLFEEPGKMDEVSNLAAEWFIRHLPRN